MYNWTSVIVPDPPYHESLLSAIGDNHYGGYPAIHRDAGDPSMVQGFDLVEQRSASTVVLASTVPSEPADGQADALVCTPEASEALMEAESQSAVGDTSALNTAWSRLTLTEGVCRNYEAHEGEQRLAA